MPRLLQWPRFPLRLGNRHLGQPVRFFRHLQSLRKVRVCSEATCSPCSHTGASCCSARKVHARACCRGVFMHALLLRANQDTCPKTAQLSALSSWCPGSPHACFTGPTQVITVSVLSSVGSTATPLHYDPSTWHHCCSDGYFCERDINNFTNVPYPRAPQSGVDEPLWPTLGMTPCGSLSQFTARAQRSVTRTSVPADVLTATLLQKQQSQCREVLVQVNNSTSRSTYRDPDVHCQPVEHVPAIMCSARCCCRRYPQQGAPRLTKPCICM